MINIENILSNIRHLFDVLDSQQLQNDIQSMSASNKVIYPCDVVELRPILTQYQISSCHPNVLFSIPFSKKYLYLSPIFLFIDKDKLDCEENGAIIICDNVLDIKDALMSIQINDPQPSNIHDAVWKIVKDLNIQVPVHINHSIPGVSFPNPRLAQKKGDTYEVSIDSLNINEKIYAKNEIDAVQKALNRRWRELGHKKEPQAKYHVQNWLKTPFWDDIVKKAFVKEAQTNINISPLEKKIFDFLIVVKNHFNLPTEMRVAGGWVRDKLMGKDSDDIDIALSGMTGEKFISYILKYPGIEKILGNTPKTYLVQENPEQSKHLATSGIQLFGQKIEFVNLRSEEYANTRIPQMKMGTPEEDAKRRDLTINALFYNIETGQVEDYVGGLSDLNNKILRTPLDPEQTFKDDPLRMLRLLRFRSRFGDFQIDPQAIESMSKPNVQQSYQEKVSDLRTGPELIKMMKGQAPEKALEVLFNTNLYQSVFDSPLFDNIHPDGIHMNQETKYHQYNLLYHTLKVVKNMNDFMIQENEDDDIRGLMNLSALFHDFGKMNLDIRQLHPDQENRKGEYRYKGHEDISKKMAEDILKKIGVGDKERRFVNKIIDMHMRVHDLGNSPKAIGKFLRDSKIEGQEDISERMWKYIIYHGMADEMATTEERQQSAKETGQSNIQNIQDFMTRQKDVKNIQQAVLDGNQIMQLFPELEPKSGFINEAKNILLEGQDEGTIQSQDDAIQKLTEMRDYFINKYLGNKVTKNWWKIIKKAYEIPYYEQKDNIEDTDSIKHLKRNVNFPFKINDKVRDKQRSMVGKQRYGAVSQLKDNVMEVTWDDGEVEKFDMRDPRYFYASIIKA